MGKCVLRNDEKVNDGYDGMKNQEPRTKITIAHALMIMQKIKPKNWTQTKNIIFSYEI